MKRNRCNIFFVIMCICFMFANITEIYATTLSPVSSPGASGKGNETTGTAKPMENLPAPSLAYSNTRYTNKATAEAVAAGAYSLKATAPPKEEAHFSSYEEVINFVFANAKNLGTYKNLSENDLKDVKNYMLVKVSDSDKKKILNLMNADYNEESPLANGAILKVTEKCGKALAFFRNGGKIIPVSDVESLDINSSQSMAVGEIYAPQDENSSQNGDFIVIEDAGDLESALAGLVEALGDGVNWIAQACDASLDRLVFGRLIHYGTNYYCFELVKGNPYGIVGSYVYKLFRNVAVPFVLLMVLMRFAKAAWNSGSGEQRRVFKDSIGY